MSGRRYAEGTGVSVEQSRTEIERTLSRYGADAFAYATDSTGAIIRFRASERFVQFELPIPGLDDPEIARTRAGYGRSPTEKAKRQQAEQRRRWRALLLSIKAKLEAVESGITTFESEFLAHIVLPDGTPFGRWAQPQIERAYETSEMPTSLLALPAGDS